MKKENLDFMIFANPIPVNGHLIEKGGIEKILQENPETLFVIDEADTVSPSRQAAHLTNRYNNAVFLGSLSKFYGLSGLRIGYLVSPKIYTKHFKNTINVLEVSSLAILAGNIVLGDEKYQQQTQKNVAQSLRLLEDACVKTAYKISATPHCFACYIYFLCNKPKV